MAPELSIIIVNWNGGELLRSCLKSIARFPPSVPYDIVIVDNASSDDSVGWLKSAEVKSLFPHVGVHVIENRDNLGFGAANNKAFAYSHSPLLFLLNPDTELTAGAVDTLIETIRSNPQIGAVGPRLNNTDGSLQHSVWRNPPTPWSIIVTSLGLWRLIPRRFRGSLLLGGHWSHDQRRSVPLLFGAAILVRQEVVQQVGGFDKRFHMYGEDHEWCIRIARAGWQLIFEPEAVVTHHGSQFSMLRWDSMGKLQVQMEAYATFQRICLSRSQMIANLLANCLVVSLQRVSLKLRGQSTDETALILRMHVADLKRALSGS